MSEQTGSSLAGAHVSGWVALGLAALVAAQTAWLRRRHRGERSAGAVAIP